MGGDFGTILQQCNVCNKCSSAQLYPCGEMEAADPRSVLSFEEGPLKQEVENF